MIRPDINAIGAKWLGELRIQDRIVTFAYVRGLSNARGAPVYGFTRVVNLDEGRFEVLIQDPETWPVGTDRPLSDAAVEEVIIHELVHVRTLDFTADNTDPVAIRQEERAVWAIARALQRASGGQRAAIVRAMSGGKVSASRGMQARRNAMIDAATAKSILDALQGDDIEAMKSALRGIVEAALTGGASAPTETSPESGQAAEVGAVTDEKKEAMQMGDKPGMYSRAMAVELAEIKRATAIVQEDAKRAIVRGMVSDGVKLTPHAEKQILEAASIESARALERMARSMSAEAVPGAQGNKPAEPAVADRSALAGLNPAQRATYKEIAKTNPSRAETYRVEAVKHNAAQAGKGTN